MIIVVSWHHYDGEYYDEDELIDVEESSDDMDLTLKDVIENPAIEAIVTKWEGTGVTIDQGGSANTADFDLPDQFDAKDEGEGTAKKLLAELIAVFAGVSS